MKKTEHLKPYLFPVIYFILFIGVVLWYNRYKESTELYLHAKENLSHRDFYHAAENLKKAIAMDGKFQKAHELYARIYIEVLHDYAFGEKITSEAINEGCSGNVLHFLRGKALYYSGKHQSALNEFSMAEQQGIKIDSVQLYIAQTFLQLKDYKKSVTAFSSYLKNSPLSCMALQGRAESYYQLRNYPYAIDDLTATLNQIQEGKLYFRRAEYYLASGDTTNACTDIANAITHDFEEARNLEIKICY
jgi:tetratricopeptide (TPR) repeat protein